MIEPLPEGLQWRAVSNFLQNAKHRSTSLHKDSYEFDIKSSIQSFETTLKKMGVGKESLSLKLFNCNTFSADTRIIFNKSLTTVGIIYDHSMTETLNALNLFYLHNAIFEDYRKYTCKLMANAFFCAGNIRETVTMVKNYLRFSYVIKDNLSENTLQKAKRYSAIQHLFIIFHEIGHLLCKHQIVSKNNLDVVRTRLESIIRVSYDVTKASEAECNTLIKNIYNDNHIIEDCYCDNYATEYLLHIMNDSESNYSLEEVCEAVYIAISFQKLLELINGSTVNKMVSKSAFNFSLRESSVRNWIPIFYYMTVKSYDWQDAVLLESVKNVSNDNVYIKITKHLNEVAEYFSNVLNFNSITRMLALLVDECTIHDKIIYDKQIEITVQDMLEQLI